jgi:hypothetical protein
MTQRRMISINIKDDRRDIVVKLFSSIFGVELSIL